MFYNKILISAILSLYIVNNSISPKEVQHPNFLTLLSILAYTVIILIVFQIIEDLLVSVIRRGRLDKD